jgi:hypothetical protein
LERAGVQPSHIDQIDSENDSYQAEDPIHNDELKLEPELSSEDNNYIMIEYLPEDLSKLLHEK